MMRRCPHCSSEAEKRARTYRVNVQNVAVVPSGEYGRSGVRVRLDTPAGQAGDGA